MFAETLNKVTSKVSDMQSISSINEIYLFVNNHQTHNKARKNSQENIRAAVFLTS